MSKIIDAALERARTSLDKVTRLVGNNRVPVREASPTGGHEGATTKPLADVCEGASDFVIIADVPGGHAGNTCVFWEDGILTIDVRRSAETSTGDRWRADFYRSFHLPENADGARAKSRMRNGVLTVRVPKMKVAAPTLIAIAAA